ncbi:MAG: hypothetical protein R3C49_11390 [Planctomycetaceae bacterium]
MKTTGTNRRLWLPTIVLMFSSTTALTPSANATADDAYQTFDEAWGVGVVFYNARNFESARKPFEAALKLATTDDQKLKIYEALIPCYRLQQTTDEMTTAVEYVLKNSKRDSSKSLTRRGYLSFMYQRGKIAELAERHEKVLQKDPNDFVALYLLSEIYSRAKPDPKRAAELIQRLNTVAPPAKDDPLAILKQAELARQLILAQDYQKGADLYEKLAGQDEKLAGYYLKEAALAYVKLKQDEKAMQLADKAVAAGADPRNEQLAHYWYRQLGEFYLDHNKPAEAIPLLKKAIETTKIEGYRKDCQAKLDEAERRSKS